MWWFWLPGYVTEGKSDLEPQLDRIPQRMPEGMIECGELLEDGSICSYSGTPAVVGKHKLDAHGICNKIKAIVMTNECPGCGELFRTVRSAKEHAHRAWNTGRCPNSQRAARPYSFDIAKMRYEGVVVCPLCQVELPDHQEAISHFQQDFQELLRQRDQRQQENQQQQQRQQQPQLLVSVGVHAAIDEPGSGNEQLQRQQQQLQQQHPQQRQQTPQQRKRQLPDLACSAASSSQQLITKWARKGAAEQT